ncbi:hypothetical protein BCR44DRAFT_54784 [Catenaria anguillulae PL171]|uniref:ABC transporter domain-containing protein n=1 Tax=Catenaria anguillulae PL171 TaxID=765915 RepID=A0A1Y2HA26_9FUNG|nr:hypothetical protein BCR44DRAFT_54784 [Catenaria anguillulae PL171]
MGNDYTPAPTAPPSQVSPTPGPAPGGSPTSPTGGSRDNLGGHLTKEFKLREPEKSTLPVWLNQFLVLTKRNFVLILRYRRSTLAQSVFAPIVFTVLLLALQSAFNARQRAEILFPKSYPLSGVMPCQGGTQSSPCVTMFYTPKDDFTTLVMRTFEAKNRARTGQALPLVDAIRTDTSAPTSQQGIVPIADETVLYNYILANPNTTLFSVTFQSRLPNARYQLWYNTTQFANGTDLYDGQVLSAQRGLDEALLAVASDSNAVSNPGSVSGIVGTTDNNQLDIHLKDWPTVAPSYIPDTIVSQSGPLFFFCSVMVIFISVLQEIVTEKELLLRHAMATMGLKASVFWSANFLSRAVLVFVASLVTVIMGIICQFAVFQADFFALLFMFFLFGMAMVSMAFFITTFCRRARIAVLVGIFIFIIGLLFQSTVFSNSFLGYIWFDTDTDPAFYIVFSLLPFFHFGKLFIDISLRTSGRFDFLTGTNIPGPGFPFSALYEPLPSDQLPTFGGTRKPNVPYPATSMHLLIFNIVLYTLLAWYFDKVIPDEYGRRQPAWFFLLPRYWGFGTTEQATVQEFIDENQPLGELPKYKVDSEDVDVAKERARVFDKNVNAAIRIGNLRKVYRNDWFGSSPQDKVAVRSLCLALEESSLLALLGQNGAGKSTTMSMLSGLTPPSGGDAVIFGHSVSRDMEKIRANLGICPQHDLLFGDLTPVEHIELYGGIKHLSKTEIHRICKERLEAVRLWKVKDQPASTFSGGMKRRLSVVISTIGDPKVLILDEPTTGMDPVNRRHVWAFIEAFKKNRICILTTHSMEEADALGDRVAIMALGRLRALGTGVNLKNKFGLGYRIGMTAKDGCMDQAKALVTRCVPEAELEDDSAGALIYRLPQSSVSKVPAVIKILESEEGNKIVESFGVSQTSLEDVFLKLVREAMAEAKEEKEREKKQ